MEVKSNPKPYTKLAEEILPIILKKYYGNDSQLLSWDSHFFTKEGDNYLGKVKCVTCIILQHGKQTEMKFVVKLNPRRSLILFQRMTNSFFTKEGRFLNEVVPMLNKILNNALKETLNAPKLFGVSLDKNEEYILLEDLRESDFRMFDRMVPMDEDHLILVVKELAKQHAASYILYLQKDKTDLSKMFPYMKDLWLDEHNPDAVQFVCYCKMRFASAIYALEKEEGFLKVVSWLKNRSQNLFAIYVNSFHSTDGKFKVICHGDTWTNNMMFRYDESGKPIEVKMLDFQQCRIASLMVDLIICLVTNTNGNIRQNSIHKLLHNYYSVFHSIFKGFKKQIPFTFQELEEEYVNKITFGILYGIIKIPTSLANLDDVLNLNAMSEESYNKYIEEMSANLIKMLKSNVSFRHRYLSLFDEGLKYNKIQ